MKCVFVCVYDVFLDVDFQAQCSSSNLSEVGITSPDAQSYPLLSQPY